MNLPPGAVLLDDSFGTTVINATDVATPQVYEAMSQQDRALISTFEAWIDNTRPKGLYAEEAVGSYGGTNRRNGGIFMRDRYITPLRPWDQMRLAYDAVTGDDIVAGVCETTESLAFSSMDFFALDADEQDVYNQIAAKIDLDRRMREIWRDLFITSQAYVAVWWETQTFKVRGKTLDGNQRRKSMTIKAPSEMSLLDPLKVVPVGSTLFGKERLAYIATPDEAAMFDEILGGNKAMDDEIVRRLVTARYQPPRQEILELTTLGVPSTKDLYLLNPDNVFRHTLTRPSYERLAPVRMKNVFELLDMKAQLRQMERAHLIGATNFIIIITKGSDQLPAKPEELANLQNMVRTLARVPVLVGDHRLNVEIVTPKLDNTLKAERWNTIDSRISGRLLQLLVLGNYAAGAAGDDSIKLVKVIARGMESRRHMIKRSLERYVFKPLLDKNPELESMPKLEFHPRAIALDFDAAYASFLFDLRQANEISRETILNQFDLDEALEAELRKREMVEYDHIFQTQVPFSTPNPAIPAPGQPALPPQPGAPPPPKPGPPAPKPAAPPVRRDNGGGRRNGGGAAPGSGQGQPSRRRPDRQRPAASENGPVDAPIEGHGDDHGGTDDADDET
jgi:hypothetical protein